MTRRWGVGPFKVEASLREGHVAVVDSDGHPFCYVDREDCAGCDMPGAKARAQRIVEALNGSEA